MTVRSWVPALAAAVVLQCWSGPALIRSEPAVTCYSAQYHRPYPGAEGPLVWVVVKLEVLVDDRSGVVTRRVSRGVLADRITDAQEDDITLSPASWTVWHDTTFVQWGGGHEHFRLRFWEAPNGLIGSATRMIDYGGTASTSVTVELVSCDKPSWREPDPVFRGPGSGQGAV